MKRFMMALGVTALFACNGAAPAPATPTPQAPGPATPAATTPGGETSGKQVVVDDIAFLTSSLTVAPGTQVSWVNQDSVGHTVTHGEQGQPAPDALFDQPLGVGETVTYTFEESGAYPVTCKIHPQMNMTVTVD